MPSSPYIELWPRLPVRRGSRHPCPGEPRPHKPVQQRHQRLFRGQRRPIGSHGRFAIASEKWSFIF